MGWSSLRGCDTLEVCPVSALGGFRCLCRRVWEGLPGVLAACKGLKTWLRAIGVLTILHQVISSHSLRAHLRCAAGAENNSMLTEHAARQDNTSSCNPDSVGSVERVSQSLSSLKLCAERLTELPATTP